MYDILSVALRQHNFNEFRDNYQEEELEILHHFLYEFQNINKYLKLLTIIGTLKYFTNRKLFITFFYKQIKFQNKNYFTTYFHNFYNSKKL